MKKHHMEYLEYPFFGLAAVGADWVWSGCDGVLRWEIK